MSYRKSMPSIGTLCLLGLAASAFLGYAPEARADEPAKRPWNDEAQMSFSNATGNDRLTALNLDNLFKYNWGLAGLELK